MRKPPKDKMEEIVDYLGHQPVVHILWFIPKFLLTFLYGGLMKENETDMVLFLDSGPKIDWVISWCLERSIRAKGAKHLPFYEPELGYGVSTH